MRMRGIVARIDRSTARAVLLLQLRSIQRQRSRNLRPLVCLEEAHSNEVSDEKVANRKTSSRERK